jgi:hypothetical protein
MSFPKVTPKQYRKCRSNRLANQFAKRMEKGLLIDRNQTVRPKDFKTAPAPSALAKFFTPLVVEKKEQP